MNYKTDKFRVTLTRNDFDALLNILKQMPCNDYAELYLKLRRHMINADRNRVMKSCAGIK